MKLRQDLSEHSLLSLLLVYPGIEQCFGITYRQRIVLFKHIDSCYDSPSYAFCAVQRSTRAYKPSSSVLVLHAALWGLF